MIFEILIGFLGIAIIFLVLGLAYKQWFFTLISGILMFLLTALLWTTASVDYHTGNNITAEYGLDGSGGLVAKNETVTFLFSEIEGFNKDRFALLTLLLSIALIYIGLNEQKKDGGIS